MNPRKRLVPKGRGFVLKSDNKQSKLISIIAEIEKKENKKREQEVKKLNYLSRLHNKGKMIFNKRELLAKKKALVEAADEAKECSFTPVKYAKYKGRASSLVNMSLYERTTIQIKKKEEM